MSIRLNRVIFYANDVNLLKEFYQRHFNFTLIEKVENEWVVLKTGLTELAFHRIGEAYRKPVNEPFRVVSNAKIVFEIDTDLELFRAKLIENDVLMKAIKSYDGFNYSLCDGEDPEGNMFQLMKMHG